MLRGYSKSEATGKRSASRRISASTADVAAEYADALLAALGCDPSSATTAGEPPAALVSAASGVMALTGRADGPPVVPPGHLASCARGAIRALMTLAGARWTAGAHWTAPLDGAALLGERAAMLGLTRRGSISAGGSCRLVRARDGWLAVNLPRADDHAAIPAWLGIAASDADPWAAISAAAARRPAAALVARARLLGLAAAASSSAPAPPPPWFRIDARGPSRRPAPQATPLVVDLSALWAGPLSTHLLALAGARVVKVESSRRLDGARRGAPAFYDLLNGGKASVALDLTADRDRAQLARLLARADIVVESARPRALVQLGIAAHDLVAQVPGLTWISITGYGRTGPGADWIAFGDDAAVAGGLASATAATAGTEEPLFCGDAIADPLTGLHAAVAALAAWQHGGGVLLSLALRDVAAHSVRFGPPAAPATVRPRHDDLSQWEVIVGGERQAVLPPRARRPSATARPLGADTDAVLREPHVRR